MQGRAFLIAACFLSSGGSRDFGYHPIVVQHRPESDV